MNGKGTLKRLEGLAQGWPQPPDELERRERERLDAMTDDELDRQIAALKRALEVVEADEDELAWLDAAGGACE